MRALAALGLLGVCASVPSVAHAGRSPVEFVDLLSPEVVGRVAGAQTVDLRRGDEFLGTTKVPGGLFVGGGFGLRLVLRLDWGVRFSLEASGAWGRFQEPPPAFASTSLVTRAEALSSLGYEVPLGRWAAIHTATVIGLDYTAYDATLREGAALVAPSTGVGVARGTGSVAVRDVAMRLGQQIGAHVAIYKALALFGDATFDWDGQYRVRFGISIGEILPFRPR